MQGLPAGLVNCVIIMFRVFLILSIIIRRLGDFIKALKDKMLLVTGLYHPLQTREGREDTEL